MTTKVEPKEAPEVLNPTKIDPAITPREYSKLDKTVDYDHAAVEELAQALNEIVILETRATYLREIVNDNKKLHPFIWTTAEGVASAIHKLEEDHFNNILTQIIERGGNISTALKSEARRRGIVVPTVPNSNRYNLSRSRSTTVGASTSRGKDIVDLYNSMEKY